jgi:hypothetical protein
LTLFKHPTGVFALSIPRSWGPGVPFSENPNVFSFKRTGGCKLEMSITHNFTLPSELPMRIVTSMFRDGTPITEAIREEGSCWNSIRQDFETIEGGKPMVWLASFYGFQHNCIIITLNGSRDNIDKFRSKFEAITKSIEFNNLFGEIVSARTSDAEDCGEIIPYSKYGEIIADALNKFWGNARLTDGSFVTPDSEMERKTLPIDNGNANAVILFGETSGLADWCGLDWQQHFFGIMDSAIHGRLNDKQMAFVPFLHGRAMGAVASAVKGRECTLEIKNNIAERVKDISNKRINFVPSAPAVHKTPVNAQPAPGSVLSEDSFGSWRPGQERRFSSAESGGIH